MNPSDTLFHNAPDLLEYIGVFLVHPVCQVSSIIKDLKVFRNINGTEIQLYPLKDLTSLIGHMVQIYSVYLIHLLMSTVTQAFPRTMLGCQPSVLIQRSMHHQKSSSDSPFQENTATPETKQTGNT